MPDIIKKKKRERANSYKKSKTIIENNQKSHICAPKELHEKADDQNIGSLKTAQNLPKWPKIPDFAKNHQNGLFISQIVIITQNGQKS